MAQEEKEIYTEVPAAAAAKPPKPDSKKVTEQTVQNDYTEKLSFDKQTSNSIAGNSKAETRMESRKPS